MTLHEAIELILKKEGRPLSTRELAEKINKSDLYRRQDDQPLEKSQIRSRVMKYGKLFDYVNGQVILTSDIHWKKLLQAYWSLSDILRSYLSRSDLQFMLGALFFVKRLYDIKDYFLEKGIVFPSAEFHQLWGQLDNRMLIDPLNDSHNIFSDFLRLLQSLPLAKRFELYEILNNIDTENQSEEEFGAIFEYFLHLISVEFASSTIPYTPKVVQELMVELLQVEENSVVFDPAAGSAGLLIETLRQTKKIKHLRGNEINTRVTQLAYMNLIMNGYFSMQLEALDSLLTRNRGANYDYIISDLPLNGFDNFNASKDLFANWGLQTLKSTKGYSAPVLFVLSSLSDIGRAVITVAEGFLFKGGVEKRVRQILIDQDVLETVISLPSGAFSPYTSAKSSIVILNKNKSNYLKGRVQFIQSVKGTSLKDEIDIEEILHAYRLEGRVEKVPGLRIIDYDQLSDDLNLTAAYYSGDSFEANEMLASKTGEKLGDLVSIVSGTSPKKEDLDADYTVPLIRMENLSNDILENYAYAEKLSEGIRNPENYKRSVLLQEGLLIGRIGNHLKPTFFKPTPEYPSVLFHSSIFALKPKKNATRPIDLEYLYYQLNTDFVLNQINKKRSGAVMPNISIKRLSEVVIPYVDLAHQRDFISTQKATIIAAERAKTEQRIKALGQQEVLEEKESDIVRTLVHQLRPTLLGIDLQVKAIKRIVEELGLEAYRSENTNQSIDPELVDLIDQPENDDLGKRIEKLKKDSLHLNDVLTSVNKVMTFGFEAHETVEIDILEYIDIYIREKKVEGAGFEMTISGRPAIVKIYGPAFRELLDQLLRNAVSHAFSEKISDPRVSFTVRVDSKRPVAILTYRNNGKPFRLTQAEYFTLFSRRQNSQGSGIGGNYIYRIVKAHGGDVRIKENPRSGFEMTIELPLAQIETHE